MTQAITLFRKASDVVPLTWAGLWLGVLSSWALFGFGYGKIDLVLLLVGGVGLTVVLLSALAVLVVSAVAYAKLRDPSNTSRLEVECGYARRTGFVLPSLWFVPFAELRWTWVSPQAIVKRVPQQGKVVEQVIITRRGEHDGIRRRFEVHDTFGLARMAFEVTEHRKVRAVPSTGNLESVHVVRGLAGGDGLSHPDGPPSGDPYDMRQYATGDPIKFVLWKVFARNRQLVIRTPERALSPVQQTVAYLVAGKGDEPAAGAAKIAVKGGSLGADWVLGADGVGQAVRTMSAVDDVLIRSASVSDDDGASGLLGFLEEVSRSGARRTVLFCPCRPGPWLDRVEDVLKRQDPGAAVDVIICTDGIEPAPTRSLWKRALFRATPEAARPHQPATREDLEVVVRRLSRISAQVMLVDRQQGTVHPASHLAVFREAS